MQRRDDSVSEDSIEPLESAPKRPKAVREGGDAARRMIGGMVGAGIGVLIYWFALRNGYHVLAAVGAGPGIGGGLGARRRSLAWGAGIAAVSLALTIVVEWRFLPFVVDGSLGYFVGHLGDLPWRSQLSIAAAVGMGFYFGMGRDRREEEEQGPDARGEMPE